MKIKIDGIESIEGDYVLMESKYGKFMVHESKKGLMIMETTDTQSQINITPYLSNAIHVIKNRGRE